MKVQTKERLFKFKNILFLFFIINCSILNTEKEESSCEGQNSIVCLATTSNITSGSYSISGTITGLTDDGLVLQNDSVDDLSISSNSTSFTFPTRVNGKYSVTIKSQPENKVCAISNGSGRATSDINDISVYCCYRMGGSLQGCPLNSPSYVTTIAGASGATGTSDGSSLSEALFFYPYDLTTDGKNFYVADTNNYTIRKVDISKGTVSTIAGVPRVSGSVDGPGSSALFFYPGGITTDGTNLYVADTYNYTIRKIEISSGVVTTLAGTAGLTGTVDGSGLSARFFAPFKITTDNSNLYVTDAYNNRIRKIEISTGIVTTLTGNTEGYLDGTGTSTQFYKPYGITTDGTFLYVTDAYNYRIRKIEISTGIVTTIAGTVKSIGSIDGSGTSARFYFPFGITTDGTSLFIADTDNNVIRKISGITQ
ncbi:MAG: hypothetical protein KDK36_09435 [Leptospiraceae bacterium]|nr:hypothetical protein [Leptospiraceae bacterium]